MARETALAALAATLATVPGFAVVRNPEAIEVVGNGLIVIRDGDPGEPEVLLSPLTYSYQHPVPVEVYREGGADKEAALAAGLQPVGSILEADRTLGGAVGWLTLSPPQTAFDRPPGTEELAAARFFVTLEYDTASPLG